MRGQLARSWRSRHRRFAHTAQIQWATADAVDNAKTRCAAGPPGSTTGYILRFDIRTPELVLVIGARHQREEDFH